MDALEEKWEACKQEDKNLEGLWERHITFLNC